MRHSSTACMAVLLFAGVHATLGRTLGLGSQPNPPAFPSTVQVFDPSSPDIQEKVNAAFAMNGGHEPANHGQFSSARYAFLFKPGTYTQDVPVGYYTSIVGLGEQPGDVVFSGDLGVYSTEGDYKPQGGALCSFWRSAENFHTQANHKYYVGTGMMWAVSQAAPLRRVQVDNDLCLFQYEPPSPMAGYSSGGFIANSIVSGKALLGSQQQFFARNSKVGTWEGGVWNIVLSGVDGAPPSHCSNYQGTPINNVPATPKIAEKPFLSVDSAGKWWLNVPALKTASSGTDWTLPLASKIPFEDVYVADNATDTAATINAALSSGLHVVLSPGIYTLSEPLSIVKDDQVLLGLGFPTLVPAGTQPVIEVGPFDGVRLAGPFLLQAGYENATALLQWGDGTYSGNPANPGGFYDMFARVGGPDVQEVFAKSMVRIDSGNVFGDDLWLWRADHTVSGETKDSRNPVPNGLIVTGESVSMYGLAVEHTTEDLVQWSGENGSTYFFQSELPYDVTQENWGDKGFTGYRVMEGVTKHTGVGLGVYTNFAWHNVTVQSGIVAPAATMDGFVCPLSVFLSGSGIMDHIINNDGNSTGWRKQDMHVAYYHNPLSK